MEPIKLADGTEWVPLEPKEKEALELELKAVLDKYNALYLPVVRKIETIQEIKHVASLFLLKKKVQENGVPTPYINNGESNGTTEETPKTD